MPTILSHPAVPLAIGLGLGGKVISQRLLLAGVAASILPDIDVVAFDLGVPRGSPLGHRGFTHSLAFASTVALLGAFLSRRLQTRFGTTFLFLDEPFGDTQDRPRQAVAPTVQVPRVVRS